MEKKDLKIVFFGTPDFAVESLKRLVEGGYRVVGVVTMPDKPAGRGHHLLQSDVKKYAVEQGLHLMQPVKLKDEAFVSELRSLNADLFIVIAFRMLPEVVWGMPPLGTFNLHASLLPKYRGAAPINWAVMNGDTLTGVTTFFLKHEIDTGDVIQQKSLPIGRHDNVETIHDGLMMMGAGMVIETVDAIIAGSVKPIPQEEMLTAGEEPTPAPKIFKDTCRIHWDWQAERIYNHVRGMDAAVIYSMLRCPATALSAQDLVAQYPILRLLYKVFPMLRIDREHASLSWLRESRQMLRSGQHVMIAPEGKCSPERELLPFKPGCVMLAAASGTKILPIYHNGEYHYLFGKRFRMIVGEPIAVTPAPDGLRPDEMNREAELLHDAMLALAKQLDSPAL